MKENKPFLLVVIVLSALSALAVSTFIEDTGYTGRATEALSLSYAGCTDTDARNYYTKGVVSGGMQNNCPGKICTDYCYTKTKVAEWYCYKGYVRKTSFNCNCQDGMCVNNTPNGTSKSSNVYGDNYITPWADASYSGTFDFKNTERVFSGSQSIKAITRPWGTISPQSWSSPMSLEGYTTLQVAIYSEQAFNAHFMLQGKIGYFRNSQTKVAIKPNEWNIIRMPISSFNLPAGFMLDRIYITGDDYDRVWWVDDIRLIGNTVTPPTNNPPKISFTTPLEGGTISSTITVTAAASDDKSVAGVQFKMDGNNIASEDTTSPYSISYDTKLAANGIHKLTATARDNEGLVSTTSINVNVYNPTILPPSQCTVPSCNGASQYCSNGQWANCAAGTTCSAGQCIQQCTNDCSTSGQRQCSGTSGYQICGNYDTDTCLEWSTATSCAAGQTCSNGQCATQCTNECAVGAKQCSSTSGYQVCGNYDIDSCTEWSTATTCATGTTCSAGQCVVSVPPSSSNLWVTAYIASWEFNTQSNNGGNWGSYTANEIDWSAFTHMIFFATGVNADGTCCAVEPGNYNFNNERLTRIVAAAHAHGKPILFSVGGAGNENWGPALSTAATRTTLINNLVSFMNTYKFDGIDLDPEGGSGWGQNLPAFTKELRERLNQQQAYYDTTKKPILTAAIYNNYNYWAQSAPYMDQINIMSYDMTAGNWNQETWHNNAAKNVHGANDVTDNYNGGVKCDPIDVAEGNANTCLSTIESKLNQAINAGIPKNKLGGGIDFNGWLLQGGTKLSGSGYPVEPRDRWSPGPDGRAWTSDDLSPKVKSVTSSCTIGSTVESRYYAIKKCYLDKYPQNIKWDSISQVSYFNMNDIYISYQDAQSVRNGVKAIKEAGVGGMILWEIGGGYLGTNNFPTYNGQRDELLQAVKSEVNKP
jgi:GH18 family chitinase